MSGGLLLGAGYIIAGLSGGTSFLPVLIGVGILGGAGIGLGYVVPIAVGMQWFPEKKGLIIVEKDKADEDLLMDIVLEAGAEDIADSGAEWEIETMPENLNRVKRALEEGGVRLLSAKVSMIPSNTIKIEDERQAQQVLNLMNALEENDDVQNVYANFDIPEELLEKVA